MSVTEGTRSLEGSGSTVKWIDRRATAPGAQPKTSGFAAR
jgi:hypothetical protein